MAWVRRASASLDAVYVRPYAEPRAYRKVFVAPVTVSLRSGEVGQRPAYNPRPGGYLASEDPELLRVAMAEAVHRSLVEAFTAAGYEIVGAPEADSLHVEARASDLFINAPESLSSSPQKMLVREFGDARLLLEARDARSGVVLERISHHAIARSGTALAAADDVLNRMAFDALFRRWAEKCAAELRR